jgi:hypothetical protein
MIELIQICILISLVLFVVIGTIFGELFNKKLKNLRPEFWNTYAGKNGRLPARIFFSLLFEFSKANKGHNLRNLSRFILVWVGVYFCLLISLGIMVIGYSR